MTVQSPTRCAPATNVCPTIVALYHQTMTAVIRAGLLDSRTGLAVETQKLLLSDIGLFTGIGVDKSPGDTLLFKQSALRGVSYALTPRRPTLEDHVHQITACGHMGYDQ